MRKVYAVIYWINSATTHTEFVLADDIQQARTFGDVWAKDYMYKNNPWFGKHLAKEIREATEHERSMMAQLSSE